MAGSTTTRLRETREVRDHQSRRSRAPAMRQDVSYSADQYAATTGPPNR
jgi:hypothetical protein